MDDIKPTNATPRPVMDLHPQRPAVPPAERTAASLPVNRPTSVPAPSSTPQVPSQPVAAAPAPTAEGPNSPIDFTQQTSAPVKLPPKHKAPIAAIVIALLVAAALIGLTVYIYFKAQNTVVPVDHSTTSEAPSEAPSTNEIDATSESIDAELNSADENADFESDDLSDEALEL